MSLKNEVFEGIAAYKALTPTTQDRYYNEMYDQARRQREKEEKADRDEITAAEARRGGATAEPTPLQPPPIVASTQSQGPIPLPNLPQGTGSFAQALYPDIPPTYRRGGKVANVNVRRYADGGMVAGDNPIDDIIMAQLGPRDPRADLGQYAPRPPPQRPVNPPPPVDPETQARIAAESAPNTRARQGVLPVPPPAAAPPPAVANTGFEGSPVIDPEVEARIAAERQPNQRARAQTQPDLSSAIAAAGGDTAVVTAPPPRAAVRAPAEVVPGAQAAGVLAGQANIPPPPPPGSVSPRGAAQAAQAPVVAPPPPGGPVSPGGEPMPPPTGRTSGLDEALATSGGSEASARAIQPPEQYGPNEPTSSA